MWDSSGQQRCITIIQLDPGEIKRPESCHPEHKESRIEKDLLIVPKGGGRSHSPGGGHLVELGKAGGEAQQCKRCCRGGCAVWSESQ